jgi:hypothetical protein
VPVAGVLWVFTVATYQAVMRAAGEPLGDDEPKADTPLEIEPGIVASKRPASMKR